MRIDLLCSGSKGNSCLIRHKDTQLLIDCGSTKKYLMESFQKVGACVDDTNGVLISHAHSDHVSQLKHFKHLDVYSYCDLKDALDKHDVFPNQKMIINDLSIQFIGLSHDSPHTIGFVVESETEKLVYVTDTGYVPNQIKPYIANADHYIFESNHDVNRLMQTKLLQLVVWFQYSWGVGEYYLCVVAVHDAHYPVSCGLRLECGDADALAHQLVH